MESQKFVYDNTNKVDLLVANIKEHRIRERLTQADLSAKIGKKPGYISQVENGGVVPPISTIVLLANVLNVHIKRLIGAYGDVEPRYQISRNIVSSASTGSGLRRARRTGEVFSDDRQILYYPLNDKIIFTL